jgi:hypothetical protein
LRPYCFCHCDDSAGAIARLLGYIEYHLQKKIITRFDVVAQGAGLDDNTSPRPLAALRIKVPDALPSTETDNVGAFAARSFAI